MSRTSVLRVVKSRAEETGFAPSRVCCHTFRGAGITAYLENSGKLEVAQHLPSHRVEAGGCRASQPASSPDHG